MSTQMPPQTATFQVPQGSFTGRIVPRYRLRTTKASPMPVTAKTFILTRYNSWPQSSPAMRIPIVGTNVVPLNEFQNTAMRAMNAARSEEHTSELQSQSNLVCRLLLEK